MDDVWSLVKARDAVSLRSLLLESSTSKYLQAASAYNTQGWTPLHRACGNNDQNTVAVLLEAGAKVDARRKEGPEDAEVGVTPLFVAVGMNDPCIEVVELLVRRGARLDARRAGDSSTPLHWAAHFGSAEAVAALLRHGADPCALNHNGASALDVARVRGHADAAAILDAAGGGGVTFDVLVTGSACHGGSCKAKVTARTLDELHAAILDASGSGLKHFGDVTVEMIDHDFHDTRVPLGRVVQLDALPPQLEVVVDWKSSKAVTASHHHVSAHDNASAAADAAAAAATKHAQAHAHANAAAMAMAAATAAATAAHAAGAAATPSSPSPPASTLADPTPRTRVKADDVYADFERGQAELAGDVAAERRRQQAALANALKASQGHPPPASHLPPLEHAPQPPPPTSPW